MIKCLNLRHSSCCVIYIVIRASSLGIMRMCRVRTEFQKVELVYDIQVYKLRNRGNFLSESCPSFDNKRREVKKLGARFFERFVRCFGIVKPGLSSKLFLH